MSGPLLVWDFDGTLADTFTAIRISYAAALDAHDRGPLDDAVLRSTVGLTLTQSLAILAGDGAGPALIESMTATYREAFTAAGRIHAAPYPGVTGLLAELAARGVTSAIATSRRRASTEQLLDQFGIAERFATVHCESDLEPGRGKPHPDLVLRACAAVGRPAADAVVIGDSPYDIAMGRAAGAGTIAVTWGHAEEAALRRSGPDHLVDDLDELRRLIG